MVLFLDSTIEDLRRAGEPLRLPAGSYLWREGDAPDHVALVDEGLLEVVHETQSSDGEESEVLLRTVGPGSLVGEIACVDGLARSASVRARSDVRLVRVPAAAFLELMESSPDLLKGLFREQTSRVRSLSRQVSRHQRRAITDSLTGLYNFGFFQERLEMEVARARETGDPIALVILDLDHFKDFNDSQGHPEGNRVLVRLAALLRASGRRGDVVARYGGEEFVILLYGAGRADAAALAEGVRVRVEQAFGGVDAPGFPVTVSGGVALFPDDAVDGEGLVAAADARLYAAKRAGRNRVVS